jgi:aspartate/methionine/tyrosine aminotransferase
MKKQERCQSAANHVCREKKEGEIMNIQHRLSESAKLLRLSPIRKVLAKANEARRRGQEITDLSVGRPDFDTPAHIVSAAKKAMDDGFVHYTASAGISALQEAICDRIKSDIHVSCDPEQVIVTAGATEAIFIALQAILNPGDEVLVPDPMYVYYKGWSNWSGAKCVPIPLSGGDDFQLRAGLIGKYMTPRTKAIILTSPHNPTGQVYAREELVKLGELADRHDFYIISDDIYSRLIYDETEYFHLAQVPEVKERVLIVQSFSKSYAMDGWRIGYLVAPSPIAMQALKLHQHIVSCPNSFVQIGALAALRGPQTCVQDMLAEFDRRRRLLMQCMDDMGLPYIRPRGAFYLFLSIKTFGMDSESFCSFIFDKARIAIVPGSAFGAGGEGYVRLSYATAYNEIEMGMKRFKEVLGAI